MGDGRNASQVGPCWWDRFCQLQYDGACRLAVRLKALGLRDADVASWLFAFQSFIVRCTDPSVEISLELDASENELSDEAGASLIDGLRHINACRGGGLHLRVLKLHKNKVGDDTCQRLACWVWSQTKPVEEIHLSHNAIQQKGMAALLTALAMHPKQVYPRAAPGEDVPCWVRLEHNRVSHAEYLLDLLGKAPAKLRFCPARRQEKGPSCTSFRCQAFEAAPVAHVHLFCADKQADALIETRQNAEAVVQQVTGDSFQLEPSFPRLELAESHACGRFEELKVDADGAGLDLVADSYGYLVEAVEGQPKQSLAAGDVILEIDGVQLWGDLEVEALEEAFGSRFADGARLRVARADAVRARPIWQPLPLPGPSISARCDELRSAFGADMKIMGEKCGVKAELQECGVWLRGPPRQQRWAADELPRLVAFYFPEAVMPFPSCQWRGAPEESCAVIQEAESGFGTGAAELAGWEAALRGQWQEDDDLFDEDLPVEPLEAPDEGPDVFEGEALQSDVELSQLRVLILVGLPGSGKSTLATRLQKRGWVVINQDTLGDRKKCVATANEALCSGKRVVVDRCNVTRLQRRVWLAVADEHQASAACIWLDVPAEECGDRVLQRFGHATLPAENSSLEVIAAFQERLEVPMEAEGFILWSVRDDGDLDEAFVQLEELAEQSEALAADMQPRQPGKTERVQQPFAYKAIQRRGHRALYLRAVRRQIEYYFSDRNLKQDWFFQEKISEPPEPGWLELQWILSCPRVQDVHRASPEDVLQALGPSCLKVKAARGTHWVRRSKRLPVLKEKRPAKGYEPEWYVKLHQPAGAESPRASGRADEQSDEDPEGRQCAVCNRRRPLERFSKVPLERFRRSSQSTAGAQRAKTAWCLRDQSEVGCQSQTS
ncbi:unnamed protein product [Effrenium voratum]|uniref:HTH La-type RNA-binding domain-containing protein n=1 Tax=Effrenium voratum TaxID=2562239 RepID=A0AA36HX32_9DINO|nr:unnamed protein product [Effrenium voratum]